MNCYFWTAYLSWYAELTAVEPEIHNYASIVKVTLQSKYQSYSRRKSKIPRINILTRGDIFPVILIISTPHTHFT